MSGPALPRPARYASFVTTVEGSSSLIIVGGTNADATVNYDSALTLEGGQWVETPGVLAQGRHDAAAVLVGEMQSGCA